MVIYMYIVPGQGQTTPWGHLFFINSIFQDHRAHDSGVGQGQPRVIIYINFVELESPMLHAKFQDRRTSGSGEDLRF